MSKRITLGTYSMKDGRPHLWSSFSEGAFDFKGGLEAALSGAEQVLPSWSKWDRIDRTKEVGLCVAVFPIGELGKPARVLATFPFLGGER